MASIEAKAQSGQELNTNERIDAAFAALNQSGVFAKQNFTCCSSCGHSEAYWGAKERSDHGRPTRGYAFYHQQDTEGAMQGGGLCVAFGALSEAEHESIAVAAQICEIFTKYNIEHEWDQSVRTRIFIKPFTWSRQRSPSGELLPIDKPWVVAGHSDGRIWAARIFEGHLEVRVRDDEGDVSQKRPRAREPHAELQRQLKELLDDGFVMMHAKDLPVLPE